MSLRSQHTNEKKVDSKCKTVVLNGDVCTVIIPHAYWDDWIMHDKGDAGIELELISCTLPCQQIEDKKERG